MKTIHDENLRKLAEDEDFTVEEMMFREEENREDGVKPLPGNVKKMIPAAIVILACLIGVLCLSLRPKKTGSSDDGSNREAYEELVSVTEAEKDLQDEENQDHGSETEEKETVKEMVAEEKTPVPDLSWQDEIFGTTRETVIKRPIKVSGLTENEKNLTGFRESDFVRSLSAFLAANNVSTSAVTFTGTVACSAGNAAAYLANLKGVSDRRLSVLFFPKFPGKYLFTLEMVTKEKTASGTENRSQTTVSVPVQAQTQAPTAAQTPQAETQSAYDAMRLKVKSIPGELSNYLSNPYELQYSLYDYLYKKGIRNAESASVTDYYIDSDERIATIQIKIDGIGSVTAIYDRDENSYSYQ